MSEFESPVILFDNSDPEMQAAYETARASFGYFWREICWERRRIVPALDLACVKAAFHDSPDTPPTGSPSVEHMWLSEVDFDGQFIHGVLANDPNWLTTIHSGDTVRVALDQISDWMFAINGEVFGAFTVNLMRSRMGPEELADHDAAWGLDFGDPDEPRMLPEEHPMSVNMATSLRDHLAKDPSASTTTGLHGWTLLHADASAGSTATVPILLAAGADPTAKADNGMTPGQLAEVLGWDGVVALLAPRTD